MKRGFPKIYRILDSFGKATGVGMSMRVRLIAFLSVIVVIMMMGIFVVLLISGVFTIGRAEAERDIEREFSRIFGSLSAQLGDATVQLVSLSQGLSRGIESQLFHRHISISELREHPDILEDVIGNELSRLTLALERTKCSGVFMILDATVNPALPDAEHSRAGIHMRVLEPSVPGAPDMTYHYFRGFPSIAYNNGLIIQTKWDMEFDVKGRDFFHLPMRESERSSLPISNLYYWSMTSILTENDEPMLVCSIPLVDSVGNTFGVCGFEISAVNFMFAYAPDESEYRNIFSLFGEMDDGSINIQNSFFAGRNTVINTIRDNRALYITEGDTLNTYETESGQMFYGLHQEIQMYPADSVFGDQRFAVALLVSKGEIDAITFSGNVRLIFGSLALIVLGVGISVFISKKYLSPIEHVFEAVRSGDLEGLQTNIVEIDSMIEQIRNMRKKGSPFPDEFFSDHTKRVEAFSPIERRVYAGYVDGETEKEIMSDLFITKKALKKHNERIYDKLGISGKEALMLYIELLKMTDRRTR